MAEKFRRVKREEIKFLKNMSGNRWSRTLLVGFAAAVLILIAVFLRRAWDVDVLEGQNIKDRSPAVALCREGNCFWLNKDGLAYNHAGRVSGNIILTIEDNTKRNLDMGLVLLEPEVIGELIFLRQSILTELNLGLGSGETSDINLNDFDFTTSEGWRLRLTTAENAYKTIATLKQSLAEITKTAPSGVVGLEYIDLRIPDKVYYKFK